MSTACPNWNGSFPCLDGGRLPLLDGVALEGPKYSELATLRLSSVGECTDAASCHGPKGASERSATSAWPKPNEEEKPLVLKLSILRLEVKFTEVGSRTGFAVFVGRDCPTALDREVENKEAVLSAYECRTSGCTRERFLGGETPERTREMLDALSPHTLRPGRQPSDSEEATSEPEPVLPSMASAVEVMNALFSVHSKYEMRQREAVGEAYREGASCLGDQSPILHRQRCHYSRCCWTIHMVSGMYGRDLRR